MDDERAGSELDLDRIREILFGSERREIERRLAALDERLGSELAQLREEIKAAIEPVERFGREEVEALGGRLREQEKARVEAQRASEERARQLVEEMRTHTLEELKLVSDEARRRLDILSTAIKKSVRELDQRKMDRNALAGLLSQTAASVGREAPEPSGDEEEAARERHH